MLSDNQLFVASGLRVATTPDLHRTVNAVVRPQSLADETYRQLLLQLDMGLWRCAEKLPAEKTLAESFGVSRPILREALARLKADGRIESRQGAGAFVADRSKISAFRMADRRTTSVAGNTFAEGADAADIAERDMLELRQIVESGAAELAAARRTAEELALIHGAVAAMDRAIAARVDGSDVDDAFHNAIAAATHNAQLAKFVEFLGAQFSASRKVTWDRAGYSVGITELDQLDHHAIFNAIKSGDAALAKTLSHAHVQRAINRVNICLQQRRNERKLAPNSIKS